MGLFQFVELIKAAPLKSGAEVLRSMLDTAGADALLKDTLVRAAAAEMLQALREILAYWESTGFASCEPNCDCIVESARAAIRKAEGER